MSLLQRLLLLPLLSPLLALLLLAAVNPRPWVALRLLTWTSPAWPLGAWIGAAAAVGMLFGSAVRSPQPTPTSRLRADGAPAGARASGQPPAAPDPWQRR